MQRRSTYHRQLLIFVYANACASIIHHNKFWKFFQFLRNIQIIVSKYLSAVNIILMNYFGHGDFITLCLFTTILVIYLVPCSSLTSFVLKSIYTCDLYTCSFKQPTDQLLQTTNLRKYLLHNSIILLYYYLLSVTIIIIYIINIQYLKINLYKF